MTHAFAIVLVKPCDDLRAEVARILEPFNEQHPDRPEADDHQPDYWWDWWRVGGRWDGVILGKNRNYDCPRCFVDGKETGDHCHYSDEHEQLTHNAVPVVEMGECRPFMLVTPDGAFSHRIHFVPDPSRDTWPWAYVDNDNHDRWCIEQLLAHRDHIAVGVDYHE